QIVTRSYGISGPTWLAGYLASLAAIVGCAALAWARPTAPSASRARWFLLVAGLAATLGTVAIPEIVGLAFLVGQRIPVIGMLLACALGGGAVTALPRLARLGVAVAVGLAVVASGADIMGQAARVD